MMRRATYARITAPIALAVVGLGLTGCTPTQPILARVDRDQLQFQVCDALTAEEISVTSGPIEGIDYVLRWRAQGEFLVASSLIVDYGTALPGWQDVSGPDPIDLRDAGVNFRIGAAIGDTDQSDEFVLSATFNGNEIDGNWRDADGNIRNCGDFD